MFQAGKDVQCKVEKKLQNLGGGVLSKTIMVTCDDEDSEEDSDNKPIIANPFEAMLGSRPMPRPPMSLLAPILKMMAARANARLQRQMKPKVMMRRFPQPIGMNMNGPFPQPFNAPYPVSHFDGPMPFPPPMMNSGRQRMMENGPHQLRSFPEPLPIPGNSIMHQNMRPMPFFPNQPPQEFRSREAPRIHFNDHMPHGHMEEQNGEIPQGMLFREDFDEDEHVRPVNEESGPIFRPFPAPEPEQVELNNEKNNMPIKVINGFPPQIPDAIKQIVSHIMRNTNKRDGPENMPVIAIRAFPESQSIDSNQSPLKSKLSLPFPFRAVKMHRGGRKLEDNDEPINRIPFPFPRGAIPAGMKPIVMPEAAGRALDSPVTLPSMQEISPLRFFPGRLLRLPVPLRTYA